MASLDNDQETSVANDTIFDAKGDLPVGTGADTAARLAVGTNGQVLKANSGTATGLEWAAESGGSGDVATDAIWDAKGDIAAGTGANTAAKLTVGANDTILMADSGEATGLKWVASATPSAVSTANAAGTADTFTRGDHVHAHEAGHVVHDTVWDAAGDLVQGTGADTGARLAIGTNFRDRLVPVAGSMAWVPHVIRKSADETVNNSTTLQNDDHLALTVSANERWFFELRLFVTAASVTSDFKVGWSVPASTTMLWGGHGAVGTANVAWGVGAAGATPNAVSTEGTSFNMGTLVGTSAYALAGVIRVAGTGGTVNFQWAQASAEANDTTVLADSCLIVWRIA